MIVDNHQNFLGILDANQAAREKNRDKKVDEVMHTECLSVKTDESIVDVINLANSSNIYTLPVVDDKNKFAACPGKPVDPLARLFFVVDSHDTSVPTVCRHRCARQPG